MKLPTEETDALKPKAGSLWHMLGLGSDWGEKKNPFFRRPPAMAAQWAADLQGWRMHALAGIPFVIWVCSIFCAIAQTLTCVAPWAIWSVIAVCCMPLMTVATLWPHRDGKEELVGWDNDDGKGSGKKRRVVHLDGARGQLLMSMVCWHAMFDLTAVKLVPVPSSVLTKYHLVAMIVGLLVMEVSFTVCWNQWKLPWIWVLPVRTCGLVVITYGLCLHFYYPMQQAGVIIFMALSGACQAQAEKVSVKASVILGVVCVLFTIVTHITVPEKAIVFGVLHCHLATTLAVAPLRRLPAPVKALIALVVTVLDLPDVPVPGGTSPMDHMHFWPSFGVKLLGTALNPTCYSEWLWNGTPWPAIGRYSLWIYVAHQGVLFPFVMLLDRWRNAYADS